MSQHTPGPWFVHDFSEAPGFANPSPADVTVSCDHPATITVASMDRAMTATLGEARANAHLIAAAPELLTALKWFIDDIDGTRTRMLDFKRNVELARAAIAKAEGADTTSSVSE